MASSTVSPDIDAMVRTLLTEASPNDLTGQLGVASVVANRLAAGGYGDSPAAVVQAPGQFEVWQNGRAQRVDPSSPAYGIAAQIAADALSGTAPDPTGGATHFYSPAGQAALGRSAPSWARGPSVSIGGNIFNAPQGAVLRKQQQQAGPSAGPAVDVDALAKLYGGDDATGAAPQTAGTSTQASGQDNGRGVDVDMLAKLYGGDETDATTPAPAVAAASADTAPPLTIHGHPGMLAAAPGDGALTDLGKNIATGAVKGVADAGGVVGNTGDLADYLMAKAESEVTGKPVADVLSGLAQDRARQQQDPTWIGRLANAIDPRQLLPSGASIANKLLALTGEYEPTSEPGRMLQAGVETAVGSLGPGVRGTSAAAPAMASTLASPGAANALMQAAGQAPGAAASGAASQYASDKTGNPLISLLAGAAPAAAAGSLGAMGNRLVGTVDPATAQLAETARNGFGIPLGAGQISDSPAVRYASSVAGKMPFSGAGPAMADQQTAFNRAVAGTFGQDAAKITPDVMQAAKTRLGDTFDRIAGQTDITATQPLGAQLTGILTDASKVLPDADLKPLVAQMGNIVDVMKQNGRTIPGESYQALTRKGAPLDRAMSSGNPNVSYYAGQIRTALDDALQASAPPGVADELRAARLQYKNMKTVEPLAEKSTTGDISPALLMGAVRNSYDGMAYGGGGDIGDLARIGQRFMKEPPSSGTSERLGMMNMLAQAGGGAASFMMGDPTPLGITAAGIPASLLVGRGVRSFLGSDGATNRLIAASLGRNTGPGLGNKLLQLATPSGLRTDDRRRAGANR